MAEQLRDYRDPNDPTTAWMKEEEPSYFYQLYRKYSADSHAQIVALLTYVDMEGLEDNPLSEEELYAQLDRLFQEDFASLRRLLRDFSVGVVVAGKEISARLAEYTEEHPRDPADPEFGRLLGAAIVHAMRRDRPDD